MYYNLLEKLAVLDRCHSGPEMLEAYELLTGHYPGSRLLKHNADQQANHWTVPPFRTCRKAELRNGEGKSLASRDQHKLQVYSYSPPVNKTVSWEELDRHLLSDPDRPESILFHFRNQYNHTHPEWGFCIPHTLRRQLDKNTQYHVHIDSQLEYGPPMLQSDYHHQGESDKTFLFLGHFDHPTQVNDGLAGCIAAYEIIKRLGNQKTRFSYRAFASVEIVGSAFYLKEPVARPGDIHEALFLALSGIGSPLAYQQTFFGQAYMDQIAAFLLSMRTEASSNVYPHRGLIGNDENHFDSAGYEIPCGTLVRWPFPQYHTDSDNMGITSRESMEEVIGFGLQVVDVIENNATLQMANPGLPCLSHPDIDLYLSPSVISGINFNDPGDSGRFPCKLPAHEVEYLENHTGQLNPFMQNILRMANGEHTLLDIAVKSQMPFGFVLAYAKQLESKGLVRMQPYFP